MMFAIEQIFFFYWRVLLWLWFICKPLFKAVFTTPQSTSKAWLRKFFFQKKEDNKKSKPKCKARRAENTFLMASCTQLCFLHSLSIFTNIWTRMSVYSCKETSSCLFKIKLIKTAFLKWWMLSRHLDIANCNYGWWKQNMSKEKWE